MYKHETQDIGLVQGIENGYDATMHPDVSRKCPGYKPPERHQVQRTPNMHCGITIGHRPDYGKLY